MLAAAAGTLQAPSACSNAACASWPNNTKRTSCTEVCDGLTASIATAAGSVRGGRRGPDGLERARRGLMEGRAIDARGDRGERDRSRPQLIGDAERLDV